MIAEPTIEQYVYYLRQVEGDNTRAIRERRAAFEGELRALLAHLERLSDQPIPPWKWPQESQDRRVSQRIVGTGWLDNPATGRSCFVEARTYWDVYWLQIGYCQTGDAGPEIFTSLRDEAWQPSVTDHLLGSSVYLCGIATDGVDEMAAQALEDYTGGTPGTIVSTHLANGCAGLYGVPQNSCVTVLFYPNAKCEEWVGRAILNNIALRLELYKHKADRQLSWCKENYPILSKQEGSLRNLLEQNDQPSPAKLKTMRRLVQLYRVFNGNVGVLGERQVTISINLDNLDTVCEELGNLAEDRFLATIRDHLRQRQEQLNADLKFADQLRQQAEGAISGLGAELELARLLDLQAEPSDAAFIDETGWPGTPPMAESEIAPLTPRPPFLQPVIPRILHLIGRFLRSLIAQLKPSQPVTFPQITPLPDISLKGSEEYLLQHIYQGFGKIFVEKEFGGGYSGTRVLLTLPVAPPEAGGLRAARRVTKIGPALELRGERDNYAQYVQDFLPFCVAPVEGDRYYEQGNRAGLNYIFVGGGALGQAVDLEEYYRKAASSQAVEQIVRMLNNLLDEDLGQSWYRQAFPLTCPFAAEYGQHLVEHLRLRLRPEFPADGLWPVGHWPRTSNDYERIEINSIPDKHAAIQPDSQLLIEGLVVKRIKRSSVKLEDPSGRGIIIGVEFVPKSKATEGLEVESLVSVRGHVVYNRHGRMEQLVRTAFPDLSTGIGDKSIALPDMPRMYPNPLQTYPRLLNRMLESRQSYVHGDLHLRNVLVDGWGKGWLIDFARVEKRHNIFDFIKLETYVRLMGLSCKDIAFSLCDYARFEEALNDAVLGKSVTPPDDPHLLFAYEVIRAIRDIARKYMGANPDFRNEYFPALFLYNLAVMKYCERDAPQPTRLAFTTACVQAEYILGLDDQTRPASKPSNDSSKPLSYEWRA